MLTIEHIHYIDDQVFEQFKKYFPKIKASKFVTKFPNTNLVIQLFETSTNFLKNSIFNCCKTDDYYGAKVLYRCLIEHYLKFQFIFTNWGIAKDDAFAKEYLEYNDAREVLDLLRSRISEQQLFDPNYKLSDWDSFLQSHPGFKGRSRKEVEEETKKYTFKNIVRFLNDEYKKGQTDASGFLGKFIVEYSSLSSFVHGGTASYYEMMELSTQKQRQAEYDRICGLSFQQSTTIKLFSLIMYVQTDKEEFSPYYLKVNDLLNQLNK